MKRILPLLFAALGAASAFASENRLPGTYRFINPLLECEEAPNRELLPFRAKLEALVDKALSRGRAAHVSVYFRDLNNGPWFGINESELFTPASLLKLPVMMALYHQAEADPHVLEERIIFEKRPDDVRSPHFVPAKTLVPGQAYTLDELIRQMILHSDNDVALLLFSRLGLDQMRSTFRETGQELRSYKPGEDFISIKEYASFFRVLFNATYLGRDMSERALELLTQSDFREGIVAGVPPDVRVAHKFGERTRGADQQLHDCGIVYFAGYPYLLGIMTRGRNMEELAGVIAEISQLVFTEVKKQSPRSEAK